MKKKLAFLGTTLFTTLLLHAESLISPNGLLKLTVDIRDNFPVYSLSYKDQPVIGQSHLGFEFKGDASAPSFDDFSGSSLKVPLYLVMWLVLITSFPASPL